MNGQADLFYESYLDGLRDDIKALGGLKVVGKWFYAEKDPEAAGRALSDRLNPDRRERLTDEQERLIIRKARESRGFSAALYFLCDDTGFERPKALNPEDEAVRLLRDVRTMVGQLHATTERLERLGVNVNTSLRVAK